MESPQSRLRHSSSTPDGAEPSLNPAFGALEGFKVETPDAPLGNVGLVNPAESGPTPDTEVLQESVDQTESLVSLLDGEPMTPVSEMTPDNVDALVEWNKTYVDSMTDKSDVTNLLHDAFSQGLLRYEEKPSRDGEVRTEVVGAAPGAKEFYAQAVGKIEAIKDAEKAAATIRKQQARQAVDSVQPAPVAPEAPKVDEAGKAEARAARGALRAARRLNELAAKEQAGREAADAVRAQNAASEAYQAGLEEDFGSADYEGAGPLGTPEQPRVEVPATAVISREQAHEAANAMAETMNHHLELKRASERVSQVLGMDQTSAETLAALEAKAKTIGEASIKHYSENLIKTVEKAVGPAEGTIRETLRGKDLAILDDLRTSLGIGHEPLHVDSDRKSLTQYFESDLTRNPDGTASPDRVLLVERIDRKSGRIVEATIVRGEDLLKTNRRGKTLPTKALHRALEAAHTETSYVEPPERASHIANEYGDLSKVSAMMRHRGASEGEIATMRQKQGKVKRRKSWWQRALQSGKRSTN